MRSESHEENASALGGANALAARRFGGRQAFREAVLETIRCGALGGGQQAAFCDVDFEDWPLGDRATIAALDAWAQQGARFTMLAQRYDGVIRQHARFVTWRKRWSHRIECWQISPAAAVALPSACWTSCGMLHRIDRVRSICVATTEAARCTAMKETIDELVQRSTAAFAATTLGL